MSDLHDTVSKFNAETPPVRLLLDGRDSAQAALVIDEAVSQGARTAVAVFDTAKTVLLPAGLVQDGAGEAYLRFNGMELSKNERVAVSDKNSETVALMAVDGAIVDLLEKSFESVVYTSPLLEARDPGKKTVSLYLTRFNTYLTVWDRGLKFAEVLPDSSVDSSLYCLQTLGREFRLRKFEIHIGGEGGALVAAAASRYFKHVKRF